MWFFWTLVAVLALGPLVSIAKIGKPREPETPTGAIIGVIVNALVILGLFHYWGK